MVTMIVAYNSNFVIGKDGGIPWHIPDDLKFFKEMTIGNSCVMGRKTWDSIPEKHKPLPKRFNVVVTRSHSLFKWPESSNNNIALCHSVEDAISIARQFSERGEVFVIGGDQIYQYCVEHQLADRVLASELKEYKEIQGTAFFPNLEMFNWRKNIFRDYPDFTVFEYIK